MLFPSPNTSGINSLVIFCLSIIRASTSAMACDLPSAFNLSTCCLICFNCSGDNKSTSASSISLSLSLIATSRLAFFASRKRELLISLSSLTNDSLASGTSGVFFDLPSFIHSFISIRRSVISPSLVRISLFTMGFLPPLPPFSNNVFGLVAFSISAMVLAFCSNTSRTSFLAISSSTYACALSSFASLSDARFTLFNKASVALGLNSPSLPLLALMKSSMAAALILGVFFSMAACTLPRALTICFHDLALFNARTSLALKPASLILA